MKKKVLFFVALLVLLFGEISFANNWYVLAGKDGEGTKADPFGTVQDAMNEAAAGDVIHIAQGTYTGEGGGGKWIVKVPYLTFAGGYNKSFTERNPFKYFSVLMRAKKTKAGYNPSNMFFGSTAPNTSHEGTIVDGLVFDGSTRNNYVKNGDMAKTKTPLSSALLYFKAPGCKIRNCIIYNGAGPAISISAKGTKGDPKSQCEISNNLLFNCLQAGIDAIKGGGTLLIKNNTIAFIWNYKGWEHGLMIGQHTRITAEKNIICYASGYGLTNLRFNRKCRLIKNNFFNNRRGLYAYYSKNSKQCMVEDNPAKLKKRKAKKRYMLSKKSKGNISVDPELKPDPKFFLKFTNQIQSTGGGKVKWDKVNKLRRILGLPLVGSKGSGDKNWAPVYNRKYILLFSTVTALKGYGAQKNGPFATYFSKEAPKLNKNYAQINYKDIKYKLYSKIKATKARGMDVTVTITLSKMGSGGGFYLPGLSRSTHYSYRTKDYYLSVYTKKGSTAQKALAEAKSGGDEITVKGTLYEVSKMAKSSRKVVLLVDEVEDDED